MNTPTHLVVSLAALAGGSRRRHLRAVAAGALLPDLPLFAFYTWQRLVVGRTEATIWGHDYFQSSWQDFFDAFNSIPLVAAGGLVALGLRRPGVALFFASMGIHLLCDLPLHREDAHRHFLPFSQWRFESPVSYWDPAHHGALGAGIELALLAVGSVVLWRRTASVAARTALVALNGFALTVYAVFQLGG